MMATRWVDAWRNRSAGERWLLAVPTIVLVVVALYVGVLEPVRDASARLRTRLPALEANREAVRAQAAEMGALATTTARRTLDPAAIQSLLDRHQLRGTGVTVDPHVGGYLFGGQAGFNLQYGLWVIGVEADISATNANGAATCGASPGVDQAGVTVAFTPLFLTCQNDLDWIATAAVRIGVTWWWPRDGELPFGAEECRAIPAAEDAHRIVQTGLELEAREDGRRVDERGAEARTHHACSDVSAGRIAAHVHAGQAEPVAVAVEEVGLRRDAAVKSEVAPGEEPAPRTVEAHEA